MCPRSPGCILRVSSKQFAIQCFFCRTTMTVSFVDLSHCRVCQNCIPWVHRIIWGSKTLWRCLFRFGKVWRKNQPTEGEIFFSYQLATNSFNKYKISINIGAFSTKVPPGGFPSDSLIKTFSSDLGDLWDGNFIEQNCRKAFFLLHCTFFKKIFSLWSEKGLIQWSRVNTYLCFRRKKYWREIKSGKEIERNQNSAVS